MSDKGFHVEMRNISKSFDGVQALCGVDFNIKSGEIHALVGENGAGKSTLIRCLSGAHTPDNGEIFLGGKKVQISSPKEGIEHGISVIYQEFALAQHLSVAENIFLHELVEKSGIVNWKDKRRRAREYLEKLGFGHINVNSRIKDLTIAYQQVIEICKALTLNASVLILDEPTAVMTIREVEQLFKLLANLKEQGVAIVYVSHRLDEIFRITDRITILKDGELVNTVDTKSTDPHKLVNMMIGRELKTFFPERTPDIGEVVLKVENIKSGIMVKDVSFEVREGEVLGLSGLVGAGRTEAVRAMLGIDKLEGGKVTLNGKAVYIKSPAESFKRGIGFLPEDRKNQGVLLKLPIRYNITLSCINDFARFGWINQKKEWEFVKKFEKDVTIKAVSLNNKVESLSGGNQQKVAIARILATNSKVLILDEPTRGVDVGAKMEIFKIINSLVAQRYAVVMISSEMTEIIGMCDRAVVIREGRSVGELQKDELSEINIIKYAIGVEGNVA